MNRRMCFSALMLVLLTAALMAACRPQQAVVATNAPPTISPTPRSTALPTLESAPLAGTEDNPLRLIFVISGSVSARERAQSNALALETALREASETYVERGFISSAVNVVVEIVGTQAEALDALCASLGSDEAAAVWVDALAYAAASARGCGTPALVVQRGTGRNAATGTAVELVTRRELSLASVGTATGRTICRLRYDDLITWVIPSLILRVHDVDPINEVGEILDFEDREALYEALAEGECDLAGIEVNGLDELDESVADELVVIGNSQTPEFPYSLLLYPAEIPLGMRAALNGALLAVADEQPELLENALGQDALVAVDSEAAMMDALTGQDVPTADLDFDDLNAFLFSTGLNFALLGN